MKKPLIVVDVDGVLADFDSDYKKFKESGVINQEEMSATKFWQTPPYEFWIDLQPLEDAVNNFEDAVKDYQVVFVTKCPNATARKDWLIKHNFLKDRVLICMSPATSKVGVLELLEPYAFIDDYGRNIKEAEHLNIPHLIKYSNEVNWKIIKEVLYDNE